MHDPFSTIAGTPPWLLAFPSDTSQILDGIGSRCGCVRHDRSVVLNLPVQVQVIGGGVIPSPAAKKPCSQATEQQQSEYDADDRSCDCAAADSFMIRRRGWSGAGQSSTAGRGRIPFSRVRIGYTSEASACP